MAGVETTTTVTSLGKYRLLAELGHGGMADVFLAVVRGPAGFNKLVVIKQIRTELAEEPELLRMFLDEARLAARLNHPNVVQTNEVGHENERYFIAMEYLEGQPLNRVIHRLARGSALPLALHLRVVSEALAGLHHAHELADYDGAPLAVVHRDITPHNIFITYDGQVKVVDFGIAKARSSSAETRVGVLKGKIAYMAPEQARGEPVDRRADLFSVGILLWEAVAGRRLWGDLPELLILQRLSVADIPPPRSVNPNVPARLEAIVQKCLSLDRESRYATAIELQADIDAYLDTLPERSGVRELGKLVTAHFEADRLKVKALIDEQLRGRPALEPGAEKRAIPLVDLQPLLTSPGSSSTGRLRSSRESFSVVRHESGSGQLRSSYSHPSTLFTSAATSGGARPPSRRGFVVAGAIAAGGLLAFAGWLASRSLAAPASAASPVTSVVAGLAPATALVEVSLAASPPEARLFLDDRPLAANPFKGNLPVAPGEHQLRVEARGYTTQSRLITLDRNVVLELALARDPGADGSLLPAVPGVPGARGGPAPLPADDLLSRPSAKPRRTLDTENPYAK